ncbi:MAG: pantoate--beta-alanine ligase [Bacteroidales bacterium]|nr:pantoate--beta-alanine ligase [Bacteroidales bacterium]
MIIINTVKELRRHIKKFHFAPLGLVPTMGTLHKGHLSLVINALKECPLIVVSIYVNPAQFNDKEDLKNYPRTLEKDLALLKKYLRENDMVFTPDDKEMYPTEDKRIFNFGNLDFVMEALHRPGHFNGVAKAVTRLFDIVKPQIAYFGMKDFQQLAVVREIVRQKKYKIRISANPIIREPDGLAMSSRNLILDQEHRKKAPVIYRTISSASGMLGELDIPEIKEYVRKEIEKNGDLRVEYFEIVDDKKLVPVNTKDRMKKNKRYFGCIAVRAGKIRLIDNIEFQLV